MTEFEIEELASKSLIRILKVLSEHGDLNITHLARVAGLNHNRVRSHVKALKSVGLVREKLGG